MFRSLIPQAFVDNPDIYCIETKINSGINKK